MRLPAGKFNNDRLALLGDRVLDLVVLQQAMRHRPDAGTFGASVMHPETTTRSPYADAFGLFTVDGLALARLERTQPEFACEMS